MDTKDLPAIVLLFVMSGLILGVGVLVLGKFGLTARESQAIVDETITFTAGAGTTTWDDITSIDSILCNDSDDCATNWTITLADNVTVGTGEITIGDELGGDMNLSYTYDKNSSATTVVDNAVTAMSPIASDWMPLMVTVIVLAIVLGLVMTAFIGKQR